LSRTLPGNFVRRHNQKGWRLLHVRASALLLVRTVTLLLPNCDFDGGKATKPAEYSLTDDAYAKLLAQLAERKFDRATSMSRSTSSPQAVMSGQFNDTFATYDVRMPQLQASSTTKTSMILASLSHDPGSGLAGVLTLALVFLELEVEIPLRVRDSLH
jgi:hypothetical protein